MRRDGGRQDLAGRCSHGVAITCGLLLAVRIALFPFVGLTAALAHGLTTMLRIIAASRTG